ncbi:MAG: ribosomal protein S18-alanine N-acetyltransferase [Candidatus Fimenecus sp.]
MKSIYFICTGNTCRSPMAEGLFRLYLHKMHMEFITVKSAGLAACSGDPPTQNAVKAAKALGADISEHRANALTPYDFTDNAYFVCMTDSHASVLRAYVPAERQMVLDVPDPFMGDETVYTACARAIFEKMPSVFRFVFGIDAIVKMQKEQVEGIVRIEKECFAHPWTEQGIREELENPTARFFAAIKDGEVVGYIGANNIAGEVYITNVAVLPANRQQGIGALLLSVLLSVSRQENAQFVSLEVRESNQAAILLYEKCGFAAVGKRKHFYRDPEEDALIYTKYFNQRNEDTK